MLSVALLLLGVFCCSTSALMIRAGELHPAVLSAYRLLAAALLLSPLYISALRRHPEQRWLLHFKTASLPGVVLSLHFISWAAGATMAPVANASLIVNMVPIAVPFGLFLALGERVTRREVVGTVIALAGVAWLAASDLEAGHLLGDAVCFGSMLLFSVYLILGRLRGGAPSLWLYVVPLYAIAGACSLLIAAFVAAPFALYPARSYGWALALALVPTILGHSILNLSMRRLSGPVVSVCNVSQFLFAGALAWILLGEAPRASFYGASALVVVGAVVVIRGGARRTVEESKAAGAST